MAEVNLAAAKRSATSKQLKGLRAQGVVPGIVYGQGKAATPIQADHKLLDKIYQQAGTSQLVQLSVEGDQPTNVLFHEVQIDPISRQLLHFDLYTVKMDEKIKTEVPLYFSEEASAVHTHGAVLLKNLEQVEVEALPANLPENIEVNLSSLTDIGDAIHVKDLPTPSGVTILADPDELVVKADPPRSEEELAELDEEIDKEAETEVAAEKGAEEEPTAEAEGAEAAATEEPAEAEADTDKTEKNKDKNKKADQ